MQPSRRSLLTTSQQSELEMARRRAQKALEGKRANQTAAKRAKRKQGRDRSGGRDQYGSASAGEDQMADEDIEAKLAATGDEKEAKRLKRLLRNRVSAQQARERKKSYVSNLETKAKEMETQLEQKEQRIKTLERENVMLRQVIKNMQGTGASNGASPPS
jgi:transcription factor HY5